MMRRMLAVLGVGLFSILWGVVSAGAGAPEPIRIASIFATTGAGAEENTANSRFVHLAVKVINASGGVLGRPLELVDLDTQSTPLGARQAAMEAARLKVSAVVGPSWSSQAMAMAPVLQQAKIPMLGATTTAPEVTAVGDYIFRVCYTDHMQADVLARFARHELGAARAAVVAIAGDVYSQGLGTRFARRFEELGGTVVAQRAYLQSAMDFREQLAVIAANKPDVVFVPGYTRDSGLILKQARTQGLSMPFLGGDGWTALENYPHLDPAHGDNFYVSHWHADADRPASRAFVALLHQEFGANALTQIDAGNANAFDAVGLVAEAMRRSGSADPTAIRDALAALDGYPGVTGDISFRNSRDPSKPLVILRLTPHGVRYVKNVEP